MELVVPSTHFSVILWFFLPCVESMLNDDLCIGTCYSGRLFPEPRDIVHGKHLNGFSYRNITTDNPSKCYSSCTQDCRCKACQMKGARCELLDEDNISMAGSFVAESGYVYYDLKQTMYQGKSHMIPPGECSNGCCRSQPCLNGGKCIEECQAPKHKFSCECPKGYQGKVCSELAYYSCLDVLKRSKVQPARSGIYTIKRSDRKNAGFEAYCDFQDPNNVWTLIESFAFNKKSEFNDIFLVKLGNYITMDAVIDYWSGYRMPPNKIEYVKSNSTLFRATCDFQTRKSASLTPDLLIGNLSDLDILVSSTESPTASCKMFKLINIRGHQCSDCTAFVAYGQLFHIHLDVTRSQCDFRPEQSIFDVDSFGFYETTDTISKCTETPVSTTQWWLGQQR